MDVKIELCNIQGTFKESWYKSNHGTYKIKKCVTEVFEVNRTQYDRAYHFKTHFERMIIISKATWKKW